MGRCSYLVVLPDLGTPVHDKANITALQQCEAVAARSSLRRSDPQPPSASQEGPATLYNAGDIFMTTKSHPGSSHRPTAALPLQPAQLAAATCRRASSAVPYSAGTISEGLHDPPTSIIFKANTTACPRAPSCVPLQEGGSDISELAAITLNARSEPPATPAPPTTVFGRRSASITTMRSTR